MHRAVIVAFPSHVHLVERCAVVLLVLVGLLVTSTSSLHAGDAAYTPQQLAFFEQKIRPVLANQCYKCHSAEAKANKKLKGGLAMDTATGMLVGGDTGPAVVAGKPEKSLVLSALSWKDPDLQMPPKTKLPDAVIKDFATWIGMGAPDPRTGPAAAQKSGIDIAKGKTYWAFTPLKHTKPPAVINGKWVHTSIDSFILAAQEAAKVTPSPAVSREKFIRRASYALRGLPPTPSEVAAFVADTSADAVSTLVDRLLASPAFGECWSRHWLDTVRYAESGGYEFDGYRPGSFHYRDWVIRSINSDMPYDQFVREQVAGDLLKPGDYDGACATGFLVAGPYPGQLTAKTEEKIRYDQLDDMVSTLGSSMLAMTVGCARCHDHKFDPLPQRDYYALAAALGKTEQQELKMERKTEISAKIIDEYEQKMRPLRAALTSYQDHEFPTHFAKWTTTEMPHLSSTAPWQGLMLTSAEAQSAVLEVQSDGHVHNLGTKTKKDLYTIKGMTYQTGLTAFRIDVFAGAEFPHHGPGMADNGNFVLGDIKIIATPHDHTQTAAPVAVKLKPGVATFEQQNYPLSATLDNSPDSGWAVDPQTGKDHAATFSIDGPPIGFPGGTDFEFQLTFDYFGVGNMRLSFAAPIPKGAATAVPLPGLADVVEGQQLRDLQAVLATSHGVLPTTDRAQILRWYAHFDPRAAALEDAAVEHKPHAEPGEALAIYTTKSGGRDVYLLRRGEVDNKDSRSEPAYLEVLENGSLSHWQMGSDADPRLGLSRWLSDLDNGAGRLLARVMVNRVWKNLFGRGLVATPNDFGLQGEQPSNPELLDHLAGELIRFGWHIKPLVREIMLSSVYQQGALENPNNRKLDPENKLWWEHPAVRLEAEAIRDALIDVAGRLDPKMYGPAVEDFNTPRRSVYLRVRRSELFPFLTLFDAPEPTQSKGDRGATTQPTQALAMMNSALVHQTAQSLSAQVAPAGTSPSDAITRAYHLLLSRAPTAAELTKLASFFAKEKSVLSAAHPGGQVDAQAMAHVCQILLCLNEFIYVD